MVIDQATGEYIRFKLKQAREAVEEGKGLFAEGAEPRYIVNSLFYGFYYPALGMLRAKGFSPAMQSVSLAMFEKEFRQSGLFDEKTFAAIRKAFDLKPKCTGSTLIFITGQDVESLISEAERFISAVSEIAGLP